MDIFKTEQFIQAVTDFELTEHVVDLEEKIQNCETYFEVGKLFDGAYPYLKHRQGKFRLIGQVKSVANKTIKIFVFYRIFERANKNYLEFLRYKGESRGDKLVQQGFQEQLAEEWAIAKQIKIKLPNPLPPQLHAWIQPLEELAVGRTRTEFHVHELDTWKQSVFENFIEADEGLRTLCELVVKILDHEASSSIVGQVNITKPESSSACTVVWAKKSATEIALLHASILKPNSEVLEVASRTIEDSDYRSRVKRAYFSIVAYSYELWRNVQKQEGGNIFLSQDEIETLTKMSSTGRGGSLPTVISGRAGSGKSTMLAYAFAALLWKKAKLNLDGDPIYISYNSKLLTVSKELVLLLLRANGEFGEQIENGTDDARTRLEKIRNDAARHFFTFHDFLFSFIGEQEQERFSEATHVDFNDFKRAYSGGRSLLKPFQNLSCRKAISAERAWFVIRQFVKGSLNGDRFYGEDAIAELNGNYQELSSKDQQGISFADIQEVYKKVYEAWYKPNLEEDNLWDDQDLVNEAHDSAFIETTRDRNFTAIVCDESQDFTPREIRFIVRASALLKYDLDKEHQIALPYILAGDSLQTLSPTGFRWSTVTSILYEEIFASSGAEVKTQTNQLSLNYRSSRPIVDFCNFIQLTRKSLFENTEKEIQHQIAWDNSHRVRPKYFQLNENVTQSELSELMKTNVFFLIPCEESGEVDFILEDPVLRSLFPDASDAKLPANVMSATAAKGLEFTHVCLYNFGTQFKKEGFEFIRSENNLAFEFFFNKLYVAASRSQATLRVIESGIKSDLKEKSDFWEYFLSPIDQPNEKPQNLTTLIEKYPDFKEHVEHLEHGLAGTWMDAAGKVSIKEAEKLFTSGKESKDPRLVNRAATMYNTIGGEKNLLKALECTALYLKFTGQNEAAGEAFENLGDLKSAWQIYFSSASLWQQANKLCEKIIDIDPLESSLVRFMSAVKEDFETLNIFLTALAKYISSNQKIALSKPWVCAQNEIIDRLAIRLSSKDALVEIIELIKNLETISQRDLVGLRPLLGEAHYITKNWPDALKVWANTNLNNRDLEKHRALAKANNRGFPDGLRELSSANFKPELVEIWRQHGSPKENAWLVEIIPAMQNLKLFEELLILCLTEHRIENALTAYRGLTKSNPDSAQVYVLSLVTECSNNFEYFGDLPMLFDDAARSNQMNIKELCETVLINAVKVWDDPKNFGYQVTQIQPYQVNLLKVGFGPGQREAFLRIVNLYQPSKEEKQLDPRWWGLCWELGGDWERATQHYQQYVDSDDKPQIKESSRIGYIRSQYRNIRYQEEIGKQTASREAQRDHKFKLGDWGFTDEDRLSAIQPKQLGKSIPFFIEPSKSGEFTEDGDFGPFSWKTINKAIRLAFDETDLALSWRIEQEKSVVVSNSGLLNKDSDGCYRFRAGDWRVEIRFSRDDIKISIKSSLEEVSATKILKFKVS